MFRNLTKGLKAPFEAITRSIRHPLATVAVRPSAAYLRSEEQASADHAFRSARTTLYDQRQWGRAFVLGLKPRQSRPWLGARLNRAMLPDVDFTTAMTAPGRRPLLVVLVEALRRRDVAERGSAATDMPLSGAIAEAGPQWLTASYSAELFQDGALIGGPEGAEARLKRPRAA